MYDQNLEASRLIRPISLHAAALLDAVSQTAARTACALREPASARNGGRLEAERPRDRLGPRDALIARQQIPDSWRIK